MDSVPVTEAARECIQLLSADLGPNIFRARVESYNPRCVALYWCTLPHLCVADIIAAISVSALSLVVGHPVFKKFHTSDLDFLASV